MHNYKYTLKKGHDDMYFSKMQGLGNDYIYINCFEEKISDPHETAKKISNRHFGVGSDGLVLICPSDKADFKMDMYNSDGSQAQMCGNAIRCVGKYVYERGMCSKTELSVETLAGIKYLKLFLNGNKVEKVRVNMGTPEFSSSKIPVLSAKERFIMQPVNIMGKKFSVTCVSMGNPHAVVFVDDTDVIEIEKMGPLFENHPLFPERINTEFVKPINEKTLKMRVWERGAGETLACGTGACAVMAASNALGYVGNEADIILLGGVLHIEWDKNENVIYMTGPAEFVFDGNINFD